MRKLPLRIDATISWEHDLGRWVACSTIYDYAADGTTAMKAYDKLCRLIKSNATPDEKGRRLHHDLLHSTTSREEGGTCDCTACEGYRLGSLLEDFVDSPDQSAFIAKLRAEGERVKRDRRGIQRPDGWKAIGVGRS